MLKGYTVPGVVTGKPIDIGGSLGRREATGRGVMLVVLKTLGRLHINAKDTKIAVQGFGNVGSIAALLLYEKGCKMVAVSDVSGGIYKAEGLHIPNIIKFLADHPGSQMKDYNEEDAHHTDNDGVITCYTDVLIPAALENQITENNAPDIRAKIIVEAANGPTTVAADEILNQKGVIIVPDILANAGGVVVSYFEWVQNIQSLMWEVDEVNNSLEKIITRAFDEVWDIKEQKEVTPRMAAYMVALKRLVTAKKFRPIFP